MTRSRRAGAWFVSLVTSLALLSPRLALADGPSPARTEKHWYGWQTLAGDGVALATIIAGVSRGDRTISEIGLGTYLFAAPLVHAAHGHVGRGFASLGIRVLAPPAVGVLGAGAGLLAAAASSPKSSSFELGVKATVLGVPGFVVGFVAGYVGAVGADAAMSNDTSEEISAVLEPKLRSPALVLRPTLDLGPNHGSLGVAAAF